MRRAAVIIGLLALGATAGATTSIDHIETALRGQGFFLEEGVAATSAEMQQLVERFPGFYFVALNNEVEGGGQALAEELVVELGDGTVVVLTPEEASAASIDFDDDQVARALVAAGLGGTYAEDFATYARQLTDGAAPAGIGLGWLPAVIAVLLVATVAFFVWRGSRRSREVAENRLEEARAEIRQQLDVIASQILELADDARLEANSEAEEHYREASETYQTAEGRLTEAATLPALEALSDDLDRARWQLDATDALLEGKPLPPAPQPDTTVACFFDPTHGAGREQATIETSAGSRVVMVCEADAEKLRRGGRPDVREIPYDQRPIPAPQAPRSHGGLGMDWLDLFSVIVGGMGAGRSYDWSGTSRLPRRPGYRSTTRSRSRASATRPRGAGSRRRR